LRRVETLWERLRKASAEAEAQAHAMGHERPGDRAGIDASSEYSAAKDVTPAGLIASRLKDELKNLGEIPYWRATETRDRHLYFHRRNFPVRIWAVSKTGPPLAPPGIEMLLR